MTMLVTALFEEEGEARQALKALEVAGFDCLNLVEEGSDGESFRLEPDLLISKGVEADEAEELVQEVRRGAALIVISCGQGRREALEEILEQFDLSQMSISDPVYGVSAGEEEMAGATVDEPIREDLPGGESTREQFQRADSERLIGEGEAAASGLSRRAYGLREPQERSEPEVAEDHSERFEEYEQEFQRHYDERLSTGPLAFDEMVRGYRYGLILAEHGGFRGGSWVNVEPFARRGWESHNQLEWDQVREAVRHGWELVQGEQSPRMGPPPSV